MIRARAAAFLLLAALVGVGCGEDDETTGQFRDGYNAAIERLNEVSTDIQESGEEPTTKPGSEVARELERVADAAAQARAELAELEPPEDARDEFDALLAAIRDGVRNFRAAADAARAEDQDRFQEAKQELSGSSEEISRADDELKDAVESD
jgi:acyl-CoA reductase-like NAD-dependent aldehyde dehydrogenase